tara:strand:- start:1187 stop:1360 length:174 start_codon:yes stop_codon:yes gene_type:complete
MKYSNAYNFGSIIGNLKGYRNHIASTASEKQMIQEIIDDLDKLFTSVNKEIIYGDDC